MFVKFWGVRGSIPTPTVRNAGIGGNTTCVEIGLPDGQRFIIDGGSGIRELGNSMLDDSNASRNLHLFLTHFHWDHIQGLPYFAPLYNARNEVTIYTMRSADDARAILTGQMTTPYFPFPFGALPSDIRFVAMEGPSIRLGETTIRSFPMHHPQGAQGYRFEHAGKVIVFGCDYEHGNPECDRILLEAARDADILIADAQYTMTEFEARRGWGHSTWRHATELAKQAGIKKLVLFHHDPLRDDDAVRAILAEARTEFPETYVAIEGETILA